MSDTDFLTYKLIAVVGSLVLVAVLQGFMPYAASWRTLLVNWRANFSLAAVSSLAIGLVCRGCVCALAMEVDRRGFGLFNTMGVSDAVRTFLAVIALDWVAWWWHRLNHRFRVLWRFHSVHHSDVVFDVSTAFRFHPGELLISLGVRLLTVALLGIPVGGILAFEVLFASFNAFVHADVRLPPQFERFVELVFVTPALHRRHHDAEAHRTGTNFGTIFSAWDRLFQTLVSTSSRDAIIVGLSPLDRDQRSLMSLLELPLARPLSGE